MKYLLRSTFKKILTENNYSRKECLLLPFETLKKYEKDFAKELNELNVSVGSGDFYAVRLLQALDVDIREGVIRLSFVHYTSGNDVDKLMSGLDRHL